MKNILFALTLVACVAGIASATSVTFDTIGSGFDCGSAAGCLDNGTSITIGDVTLDFTAVDPAVTLVPPTNTNWGKVVMTCSSAPCAETDFTGALLDIKLHEVTPVDSNSAFGPGALTGKIGQITSSLKIEWTAAGAKAATSTARYTVDPNPRIIPSIIQSPVTIEGTLSAVPEPATFALLGAGIAALALARRRSA